MEWRGAVAWIGFGDSSWRGFEGYLKGMTLQGLPGSGGTDHVLASQTSYGLLRSKFQECTRAANTGDGHMSLAADSHPRKAIGSIGTFHLVNKLQREGFGPLFSMKSLWLLETSDRFWQR